MLKDQLRKARRAAGKTQKEIAAHLGITESTYCGYETGKRQPDALKIKKIAAFLGVTGDFLLETSAAPEPVSAQNAPSGLLVCDNPDEISLISAYRSLNTSGKEAVLAAVEGIAANPRFHEEPSGSYTAYSTFSSEPPMLKFSGKK